MKDESRLGSEKIGKLMISLAIPSILAQLINVLYNLVDRMYIGRIENVGALALTGLGLCFPIIVITQAFSAFAAAGGAPLAAIALGKNDREKAEKIMNNSMILLTVFSVILPVAVLAFQEPLLYLFGASENTIGYAKDYLTIYMLGTLFVQISVGLNMFVSTQGQAKIAMLSVIVGAVANIALDPLLIFVFQMGVRGAALATIISQALSAAWVIAFLMSKKSGIRIRWRNVRPDKKILRSILALGLAPFIMRATESLVEIVLNNGLQRYGGDLHVGAMTICLSVMQLAVVVVNGFTMGVQPIISYNYGARNYGRVKKTVTMMTVITFASSCFLCLIVALFPGIFASIFTNEAELIDLVKQVLPLFFAGMWIFGIQMSAQTINIALRKVKSSLFLAVLRKLVLLIPLAIILPVRFGVMGIYWAEPISDIISAAIALVLLLATVKQLTKAEHMAAETEK